MKKPLSLPRLGGVLAILNALGCLTVLGLAQAGIVISPKTVVYPLILLSLPIAWPLVWAPPLHAGEDYYVALSLVLGLNAFAFGYGCEYLWKRLGVRFLIEVAVIVLVLVAVFWPYL